MPEKRSLSVVLLVIGTMAGVVWLYAICLFVTCWKSGQTEQGLEALKQFKDFGVYAAGALTGFLARTSITSTKEEQTPVKTEVVNSAQDPVHTTTEDNKNENK